MNLTFSLDDTKIQKKLSNLLEGVEDLTEPFEKAADSLLTFFGNDVFESQGTLSGEAWRELAETTLMAREKRQGHYARNPIATDKILIWTGDLKSGFKKEVTKKMLRIHNDVEYFKYHQLSQRRMLAITPEVIIKVMEPIHDYIAKKLTEPV